ncbi:TadE/TadG family type IV pilus assembly protein [Vibrio comitans]
MKQKVRTKGLAIIEFVLIVPVMLLVLVSLFEIGRIFLYYTTLNKAVQNGARYAVVDVYGTSDPSATAPESDVQKIVVYGDLNGTPGTEVLSGFLTTDVSLDPTSILNHIVVTAAYDYQPVFIQMPFTSTSFDLTLTASATMRNR